MKYPYVANRNYLQFTSLKYKYDDSIRYQTQSTGNSITENVQTHDNTMYNILTADATLWDKVTHYSIVLWQMAACKCCNN